MPNGLVSLNVMEDIMKARTLTMGSAPTTLAPKLPGILNRIMTWMQIARERSQLAELDAKMLRDIGLSETDAAFEARRPFWDTHLR